MCGGIQNGESAAVYEKPGNSDGEKGWINVGKIIAMAAVLTDHAYRILYTNRKVAYASYFSVTLFLFLSGAVQYLAFERHKNRLAYTKRRVWQFAVSYAVAVAVYLLAAYRCFHAGTWLNALVHFNIINAFYFVCFFIQLLLISPLLYGAVKRMESCGSAAWRYIWYTLYILALLLLSYLSVNYTCIMELYGGGKYLFGGTYLLVYGIGMCSIRSLEKSKKKSRSCRWTLAIVSAAAWILVWILFTKDQFHLDSFLPFGNGMNPPGVSLLIFASVTMMAVKSWYELLEGCPVKGVRKILKGLEYLGGHTLSIYFYHILIRDYIIIPYLSAGNILCGRILYMTLAIGIPVLADAIFHKLKMFGKYLLSV